MKASTPTGGVPAMLASALAGAASVPAPAAADSAAVPPAAAPDAEASVDSAQRSSECLPSPTWRIDASGFHDPMLAEALPTIVSDPGRVAEGISLCRKTSIYGVSMLARFQNFWRQRNVSFSEQEKRRVQESFVTRLCALEVVSPGLIAAAFPPPTDALYRSAMRFAQCYLDLLGGPALVPPAEAVANYLTGIAGIYARWGADALAVQSNPSPHNFFIKQLGGGFELRVGAGSYESIGGIDYQCVFRVPDEEHIVMYVGVIRRPEGFAIVKQETMKEFLTKEVVCQDGVRRKIIRLIERRFGHVGNWLTRQTVEMLRAEDPGAPIFWKRGIARHWAYAGIEPPPAFARTSCAVGALKPSQIMRWLSDQRDELILESRRLEEGRGAESPGLDHDGRQRRAAIAARLERIRKVCQFIERVDLLPCQLGFTLEDPESHWFVLRPKP